jgi:hypothetical protein
VNIAAHRFRSAGLFYRVYISSVLNIKHYVHCAGDFDNYLFGFMFSWIIVLTGHLFRTAE